VGGGAFFVPLFNVLLGFSMKASTALSQAVITGGAFSSVAYYLAKRNPTDPSKPLIDFSIALMLTPVLLLGVSAGLSSSALVPGAFCFRLPRLKLLCQTKSAACLLSAGVLGNVLFPAWAITFLLLGLLLWLTWRIIKKSLKLHRAEKAAAAEAHDRSSAIESGLDGAPNAPEPGGPSGQAEG
jgi:hypothetical protein